MSKKLNTKLLAEICEVAGAPGHEQRVREIVLREITSLVDEIKMDNMGNIVAIKKGKRLEQEEMKVLVSNLFACNFPSICPSGNPTIINLAFNDITKHF